MSDPVVKGVRPGGSDTQRKPRPYRYLDLVTVAFVVVLVCSNLIGPAKAATLELPLLGPVVFGAGVLFFPISYIFGDILTEVYGYARVRKVIWTGFAALLFASRMAEQTQSLLTQGTSGDEVSYDLPPHVAVFEVAGALFFGVAREALSTIESIAPRASSQLRHLRPG